MQFQLFEVWGVNENQHEELLTTTSSKKEAVLFSEKIFSEDKYVSIIINHEIDDDVVEIQRFEKG